MSTRVFQGDDAAKSVGRYVPVMKKELMDSVEVINAKWMARKESRPKNAGDEDVSGWG
jgi:tRNA pseudouridine38/39 synthase